MQFLSGGFVETIQLDIVGFLAILGEASVLANGQVAHLSRTCLLPRIIPAPQALIRNARPERLQPSTGVVVGAHSGNIRRQVNHIPHILQQVAYHAHHRHISDTPKAYDVRVIGIDWAKNLPQKHRNISWATKKAADRSKARSPRGAKASTRSWGPLIFLAYAGCAQSAALLGLSIKYQDGMSLLAVLLLSFCSSLVGLASYWELKLPHRTEMRDDIPPSDIVISYPNGSFLVVRCPEEIARLYFQTEDCAYKITSEWAYRVISLVASIFLMIGVICLANARPLLQLVWAAMYVSLNAAYWIVAALPPRWHWDMSSFETRWEEFDWTAFSQKKNKQGDLMRDFHSNIIWEQQRLRGNGINRESTFTEALWKVIALTNTSRWARIGGIAPDTPGWDEWLKEAMRVAVKDTASFPAKSKQEKSTPANVYDPQGSNAMDAAKRDSDFSHDPESLTETASGREGNSNIELRQLPEWNCREALTKYLQQQKRSSW